MRITRRDALMGATAAAITTTAITAPLAIVLSEVQAAPAGDPGGGDLFGVQVGLTGQAPAAFIGFAANP